MKNLRIPALAALAAALVVSLSACTAPWDQTIGQLHGVMTLDIGHSPSEIMTAPVIRRCAQTAIDYAARQGALLYIAPVAAIADTEWSKVDFHLRGFVQTTNAKAAHKAQEKNAERAREAVERILGGPIPPESSDEITALAQAAKLLATFTRSGPLYAVICSDGHQVSRELNIYRVPLGPAGPRRAIAQVASELVPMTGVHVVWGDVGGDRKAVLSGAREAEITHFWTVDWDRAVRPATLKYGPLAALP